MGGRLSFSAALLDDSGDGLVLTSINGRSETRTYAKGVKAGESDHSLSPEEQQAIGYAGRSAARPAFEAVPTQAPSPLRRAADVGLPRARRAPSPRPPSAPCLTPRPTRSRAASVAAALGPGPRGPGRPGRRALRELGRGLGPDHPRRAGRRASRCRSSARCCCRSPSRCWSGPGTALERHRDRGHPPARRGAVPQAGWPRTCPASQVHARLVDGRRRPAGRARASSTRPCRRRSPRSTTASSRWSTASRTTRARSTRFVVVARPGR